MTERNARLREAILEMNGPYPDMRFLFEYAGASQGYGPFALRAVDFARFLTDMLRVCGAREWAHLKGKPVRVRIDEAGLIAAVGNFVDDDWVAVNDYKAASNG